MSEENLVIESRQKILVVDDEKDLREALFTILAAQGYEVLVAEDGVSGWAMIQNEKPDLVLLDLQMPNMDGHDVLAEMKAHDETKNIQVIVLTALGDVENLSKVLDQGGTDYIVKNDIDLEGIVRKVSEKFA